MKHLALAAAAALLALPGLAVHAETPVYANDFQSAVGAGLAVDGGPGLGLVSTQAGCSSDYCGQFLGLAQSPLANNTVTLSLSGLAPHGLATVDLTLFVLNSWDGNDTQWGPDHWRFSVDGLTLLDTTFSNVPDHAQAYPGAVGSGDHPAQTGAIEVNRLGPGFEYYGSAVYQFRFTALHSASDLTVAMSASGLQGWNDEGWGVRALAVSIAAVPEPQTWALMLAGLVASGAAARRRRR